MLFTIGTGEPFGKTVAEVDDYGNAYDVDFAIDSVAGYGMHE